MKTRLRSRTLYTRNSVLATVCSAKKRGSTSCGPCTRARTNVYVSEAASAMHATHPTILTHPLSDARRLGGISPLPWRRMFPGGVDARGGPWRECEKYESTKVRRYEGTKVRRYEGTKVRKYEGMKVRRYEGTKV